MRLRHPRAGDAAAVWRLVRDSAALDLNSPYAYLLLCTHFRQSCVLAERDERVLGAVLGYRPPGDIDRYFVWQVAVAAEARGEGLARRLVAAALAAAEPAPRWLEATVTLDNAASLALFRGLARRLEAPFQDRAGFPGGLFPEPHGDERLIRVGPLEERAIRGLTGAPEPVPAPRTRAATDLPNPGVSSTGDSP
ncbi:MAG TPA: diaminobutyrate acetyltransferase [Thermoanaerobaculia bacterium]|nr:diaminobutyrate acetyltransferase [Thermoanaerobaculia bacterium]